MLEESVPAAIWASMSSWFTPTVFFVVLHLVIGTIAVTSKAQSNTRTTKSEDGDGYNNHDQQPRLLTRGSSLLTRFKSINLHRCVSSVLPPATETLELQPEPNITITTATASSKTTTVPTPSPTVESEFETLEEAYSAAKGFDFRRSRSESETHPALETERKAAMGGGLVRKSASAKKKTEREEQGTDLVERPPTVREGGGEVDARADDFINMFRKQLQLQRLNSILRYKEMRQMNGSH